MIKNLLQLLLFVYLTFPVCQTASASHISGGEITYQCLGNNQYSIQLNLYRDCSGIDMSTAENISVASACSTMSVVASLVNPGGTEVSQVCASQIAGTTCNGGSLPGMEKYTYETTVTLAACSDWVFSWSTCCRNTTVNVPSSSGDGSYVEATLNNTTVSCNNSPAFYSQPIPSVCINQLVNYNLSASNIDNDSLVYTFIAARNDLGTTLTYTSPYSATNPIDGILMDSGTGVITFTPVTLGNFIVAIQITEYDSSGTLIGSVMRDIQFNVVNCSGNSTPLASSGAITGLSGTALAQGSYALQLCSGGNFSFNISINDSNSTDTIVLTSDITTILPGATFTPSPGNPATATISWTDTGTFTGTRTFVVNANDNVCPVPGVQSYIYTIAISQGTFAGADVSICASQTATLSANGGTSFQWSAISGDSIIVGTNFSCNPCSNPVTSPDTTTTYVVTSNLAGGCTNKDTVTVIIAPDFTYSKTQSASAVCLQDPVQFIVTASGSYTYLWMPASILNNDTVNNPIATFSAPGTQSVYFTITSSSGCTKNDSFSVVVSSSVKPEAVILSDSIVCAGMGAQLSVEVLNQVPSSCGLSTGTCSGSTTQVTVGTGTNVLTNTSYPAPYGNWYMGVKHQILFTASELNALGFAGGQINSISLEISAISGITIYKNFEIKMGCTSITSLSNWESGLATVFPAQTITIAAGWNTHSFANAFNWDGSSNILVEICFNNQPDAYTYNSPTYYTNTSFNSVIYYNADNNPTVCSSPASALTSTSRPNMRFAVCSGGDAGNYSYAWFPSYGLSDSSIANPVATVTNDTMYSVIVTDTIGGCSDTASVDLTIVPGFTFSISAQDSLVCIGDSVQLYANPAPAGNYSYNWKPSDLFNDTTAQNPMAVFDSAGSYPVYISISNGGCSAVDSLFFEVFDMPIPLITGDTQLCIGDSTQLTASGGTGYDWTPTAGLSATNIADPVTSPGSSITYFVTVTNDGGCSATTGITVVVSPLPVVNLGADYVFCDTAQLTAPGGFVSYLWSTGSASQTINVTAPGSYHVKVKDVNGCMNSDTVMLYVDTTGVVQITNAPDTLCVNDNFIILTASPSGGTWSGAGTTSNGIFSPVIAGTGAHQVMYVVYVDSCKNMDAVTIYVDSCANSNEEIVSPSQAVYIFPNPNHGKFTVQFADLPGIENAEIIIINLLGETVLRQNLNARSAVIDMGNIASGIYLAQFHFQDVIITRRLVVE